METEIKINNTIVTCSYCKKAGHIESVCFKKHDYPGNNNVDNKNVKYSKRVCSFCGWNGHMIDNCYKKHGFPPGYKTNNKGGNVNSVDTNQEGKTDSVPEDHDFKLSQQQNQAYRDRLPFKYRKGQTRSHQASSHQHPSPTS